MNAGYCFRLHLFAGIISLVAMFFVPCAARAASGDLIWAKEIGHMTPHAVARMQDGGLVVAGDYTTSVTLGRGTAQEETFFSQGIYDVCVARYTPDGSLQWATWAGGPQYDVALSASATPDGGVAVAGYCSNGAIFSTSETIAISGGGVRPFLAKYRADGELEWVRVPYATNGPMYDANSFAAAVPDGTIRFTGRFRTSMTFGLAGEATQTTLTSTASSFDVFVASYSTTGGLLWAKRAGGASSEGSNSIAAYATGECLITGMFIDSMLLGEGEPGETELTASFGVGNAFVARYSTTGTLEWAQKIALSGGATAGYSVLTLADDGAIVAGTFDGENNLLLSRILPTGEISWTQLAARAFTFDGHALALFGNGDFACTGRFRYTATFGAGQPFETSLSTGEYDADGFLTVYGQDGTLRYARAIGGTGNDWGLSVAVGPDGTGLVTGTYSETVVFGAGQPTETMLTPPVGTGFAGYVAKYDLAGPYSTVGNWKIYE